MPISSDPSFDHDSDRLDQHFLTNSTAQRMVAIADLAPDDVVLDIGAGIGVLTGAVLDATTATVIAVEPDPRCQPDLRALHSANPDRLTLWPHRLQDVPLKSLTSVTAIVANPPFSILDATIPTLRDLPQLRSATVCVGRRWADRATAAVDSTSYGRASLLLQSRFVVSTLDHIAGSEFTPPINRPAALIRLDRRESTPITGLLAEALMQHPATRLKSFIRSPQLQQRLGQPRARALLSDPALRGLQQRRLNALTQTNLRMIVRSLEPPSART